MKKKKKFSLYDAFVGWIVKKPLLIASLLLFLIIFANSLILGIITIYIISTIANENLSDNPSESIARISLLSVYYAAGELIILMVINTIKQLKSIKQKDNEDSDDRHPK